VLIYVDTSDVRDGALAELKWAIEELAASPASVRAHA